MIISMLVLGALTLTFILIGNLSLGRAAQIHVAMENKTLSEAAATACAEQAMDRLGRNAGYAGNETLDVADGDCHIRPIIADAGTWTLETTATSSGQHTNYRVTLSGIEPPTISSWTELGGF